MSIDKISSSNDTMYTGVKPQAPVREPKPEVRVEETAPKQTAPAPEVPVADEQVQREDAHRQANLMRDAIAEANRKMNHQTRCEFSYHEETKRVSIKILDAETNEVIKEIPPEETLDMLTKLWEVAGIMVDEYR